MGSSGRIGAIATTLASLGTVAFMIYSLNGINMPYRSWADPGYMYGGYAAMIWIGIAVLAFGWTGAVYAIKKQHFWLALTGAVFVLIVCPFEFLFSIYAPSYNPISAHKFFLVSAVITQFLLAFLGVFYTTKAKHQFT